MMQTNNICAVNVAVRAFITVINSVDIFLRKTIVYRYTDERAGERRYDLGWMVKRSTPRRMD